MLIISIKEMYIIMFQKNVYAILQSTQNLCNCILSFQNALYPRHIADHLHK